MLSIYTLKSAKDASTYYQQGDYYTQSGTEEYSFWWGKGAKALELKGSVDFKVFTALLEGRLPNQEEMIQTKKGQYHRPGYDLTFSAPKSVSILALVLGNQAVLQAHREAIKEVLTHLEKNYAAYRAKKPDRTDIEKSGNYTVAAFEHSDSRAGDPNLHTHAVLMNMTQRADGAWRALYADALYTDKLFNGMEYRSLLARKLLHLGFELEFKEKGLFEIKGIPEHLLKQWSTRHEEIEKWLAHHQLSGGEAASHANFQTRGKKVKQNPEERVERWLNELKCGGFTLDNLQAIVEEAKVRGPVPLPDPYTLAQQGVNFAIQHLSERYCLFSIQEAIKAAKWMSLLPSSEGDFLKIIEEKIHAKTLWYVEGKWLVTPETMELQQKMLASLKSSKSRVDRMMAPWVADLLVGFKVKTEPERETLKEMLTNSDQQILVSAPSRASLLNVLKQFKEMAKEQHYYPRFLTQTQLGVESLKEKLGTERVSTLAGFLLACEIRSQKQSSFLPQWLEAWDKRVKAQQARELWVVNGAISIQELSQLQHWSQHFGARLILTQTKNQKLPLLTFLKENGIREITLSNAEAELSPRMALLTTLRLLEKENALQSVLGYQERLQKAVDLYEAGAEVVVLSNPERLLLNERVRMGLKVKRSLTGESALLTILQPLSLSKTEKNQAHLYQLNDVIRFNQAQKELGIKQEEYFKIKDVNLAEHKITLQHSSGKRVEWELQTTKFVDVFREEKREVMIGDSVVWTRTVKHETDKSLDRIKNQKAVVTAIQNNQITIALKNGKAMNLNTREFKEQHWDYGYATLLKNGIGKGCSHLIAVLPSFPPNDKMVSDLQELLNGEHKSKYTVLCEDAEKIKNVVATGIEVGLPLFSKEISYNRQEALREAQTTITQSIFHRLQGEYLNIRKENPEFLEKNLEKSLQNRTYSPTFRAACYAVETVILYHSERDAVFSLDTLKKESREVGGLTLSRRALDGAMDFAIKKGWLVLIPQESPSSDWVAARHTVLMEKLCIQKMKQGQHQLVPILSSDSPLLTEVQTHKRLTKGQKEAVTLMLTSPDKLSAIQGVAGAGKTTALKEVKRLCEASQFKSLVLANTASAKNQAHASSGIASQTTAQFLTRMETQLALNPDKAKKDYGENQLIILDEASLIATKEQFRLTQLVEQLGARLNFVGDFKQQGSIGAGTSLHDLLAYGVNKAVMAENVRLKEPKALEAMKKVYAGDMAGTLNVLQDTIEEIPDKKEALEKIAHLYMALPKKGREHALIIMPLNEDRRFVNNAIRAALKQTEELTGETLATPIFLPRDRREVDKREIASFKVEDVIRFNTNHPRLGIKAGDYLTVVAIDLKHHRLTLQGDSNQRLYWAPKNLKKVSDIEIYQSEQRELMQNDIITFKRNQETKNIFNGDKATILNVLDNHQVELLLANGQSILLDLNQKENQHLDYGYALTTFAAQGRDVLLVLAYGEGPKPYLRKTSDLKIGDTVVLTRQDHQQTDETYQGNSSIGQVVNIEGFKVTVRKVDKLFTVSVNQERLWDYFPPWEDRKAHELPLSTSQQGFLTQITRGDLVYLIVPYLADFQKTLENHETSKQSALSLLDPRSQELHRSVNRFVENIRGIAEPAVPQSTQSSLEQEATLKNLTVKPNVRAKQVKSSIKFSENAKKNFIDKEKLNDRLGSNLLDYASQWLGSPTMVSGREARWGRKGSFSLGLSGSKEGCWSNWETGKTGRGLISLYMALHEVSFSAALKELAKNCGLESETDYLTTRSLPAKTSTIKKGLSIESEKQQSIQEALKKYQAAIPIQGTLAEKYLRKYRKISGEFPEDFRFIKGERHFQTKKGVPALVAPYRNKDKKIVGIVRIYLNQDGSQYTDTFIDRKGQRVPATPKANKGLSAHGSVIVQEGLIPRTVWIAEGVETALSIAKAVPHQTVVASLAAGQIPNVPISAETEKVVICADNDPASSNTKQNIIKAVQSFLSQGKRVFIAIPPEIPTGMKKYDFNDLLKKGGVTLVQNALDQMIEIKDVNVLHTKESRLEMDMNRMREKQQSKRIEQSQDLVPMKLPLGKEIEF